MSDTVKKKWRTVKKNRHAETSSIQQNLRSNKTEADKSEFKDKTNNLKIASSSCNNNNNSRQNANQRWKIKCTQCNSVNLYNITRTSFFDKRFFLNKNFF